MKQKNHRIELVNNVTGERAVLIRGLDIIHNADAVGWLMCVSATEFITTAIRMVHTVVTGEDWNEQYSCLIICELFNDDDTPYDYSQHEPKKEEF